MLFVSSWATVRQSKSSLNLFSDESIRFFLTIVSTAVALNPPLKVVLTPTLMTVAQANQLESDVFEVIFNFDAILKRKFESLI